jgi:hypothetical protein
MTQWLHYFFHLVVRTFINWYTFLGTSPAGIAVQIITPVLTAGWRLSDWRKNWPGELKRAAYALLAVWTATFIVCIITTVYHDHQFLVKSNESLRRELSTKLENPFAISFNNEYASISNTVQAFRFLMPQQIRDCSVRITAPRENRQVAQVLASLGATFCRVDAPYDPAEPDDEALRGALKDAILIHMKKTVPDRAAFVVALGNVFSVRRTYDLPSGSPDELVWIQIGEGNPWRKDPTKPGTD